MAKSTLWREELVGQVTVHHCGKSASEREQGPRSRNYGEVFQAGSLSVLFTHAVKAHLPRNGVVHSGLIPVTSSSIKQDNPLQTWPQAHLI